MLYNVYCDESGHLQHDANNPIMALGAVYCPSECTRAILDDIHNIKLDYGFSGNFEIKWTKISVQKMDFYKRIVNYFFDNPFMNFRVLIADKRSLEHERFNQSHDDWYYKMYYQMLENVIYTKDTYNIYLDIKDTRSANKARHLKKVLSYALHDFEEKIITRVQHVHSHEIGIIQITDLLTGAAMHANKRLILNDTDYSDAKKMLIDHVQDEWSRCLTQSTPRRRKKFNVFVWRPR